MTWLSEDPRKEMTEGMKDIWSFFGWDDFVEFYQHLIIAHGKNIAFEGAQSEEEMKEDATGLNMIFKIGLMIKEYDDIREEAKAA